MGSEWRMPTTDELQELLDNCTWTWTTHNGVNGYKVTGNNGNSIFLPAAGSLYYNCLLSNAGSNGDYWSSSLDENYPESANQLNFGSSGYDWFNSDRCYGYSVRAVVR